MVKLSGGGLTINGIANAPVSAWASAGHPSLFAQATNSSMVGGVASGVTHWIRSRMISFSWSDIGHPPVLVAGRNLGGHICCPRLLLTNGGCPR